MATLLQNPAAATDLISFLSALPDCRMRRGIRYPQWWMLLVGILAILSGQGSLLGTHVTKPPSDSIFRLLLAQLDVEGFEAPAPAVDGGSARCHRHSRHSGVRRQDTAGLRPAASTSPR